MKACPAHGGQKSSTGDGLTSRKPETGTFTVNLISDQLQEATRRSFKPSGRIFSDLTRVTQINQSTRSSRGLVKLFTHNALEHSGN